MKATIDDDRCRGHGVCCTICPEVFALHDAGYAVVQIEDIPEEFEDAVEDAARSCPERAITTS
ncbi:ferredoxin [Yinghuangia sp. ASG 101]|uniref:ferredoxin n=1 Tax=Yinghuangia sp. ASG 101 TaxID=2896848 RepID=UPI001E5AFDB1|nr:ferredoxin [Yinghuangia sp. ASG 101]UGQ10426.1 ferredoxin [Yinghuangia sp. ASG 101]